MLEELLMALFGLTPEPVVKSDRAEVVVHASRSRDYVQYAKVKIQNDEEFKCFDELMHKESSWRTRTNPELADNPNSSAYGIPQALPGNKMAAAGYDWATNPITQIRWVIDYYLPERYEGSPCKALEHHKRKGWY
jgi:hypothetical protein